MKNFFEIFEIEPRFDLNKKELESRYFALQRVINSGDNKDNNDLQSHLINEAFAALEDDFSRACYLLKLKAGLDVLSEDSDVKAKSSLLQEAFLIQEKIVNLGANEIGDYISKIKADLEISFSDFASHFTAENYHEAAQILIKIRFLKKSLEDLKLRSRNI